MANDDDSPVATAEMCTYCFDVLLNKLRPSHDDASNDEVDTTMSAPQQRRQYTPPNVKCPLFVTWEKCQSPIPPPLLSKVSTSGITTPSAYSSATASRASSSIISDDDTSTHNINSESDSSPPEPTAAAAYDLRGCIGTLAKRNLQHALSEFAITSALHDRRFDPISIHELPMLRVGVSLLVKYEVCQDCLDWVVGVHGIIIKFGGNNNNTGEQYSATYLPEVAKDQSWNQKEAVVSLIRKAGYHGHVTNELLSSIHCTRYQSSKFRVSYQDYVMMMHAGKDPLLNSADLMMATIVAEEMAKKKGSDSNKFCAIM